MSRERTRVTVAEVLPELAAELSQRLDAMGETALAQTVPDLRLMDRCRCGDHFCATFYTAPPPQGAYGPSLRSFDLESDDGMVILDVVEDRIVCVEILYRPAVRERLIELLR